MGSAYIYKRAQSNFIILYLLFTKGKLMHKPQLNIAIRLLYHNTSTYKAIIVIGIGLLNCFASVPISGTLQYPIRYRLIVPLLLCALVN